MQEWIDIKTDDYPAWYEIGFDPEKPAITLRIHHAFFPRLQDYLKPEAPIIILYQDPKVLALDEFILPRDADWGFGSVLKRNRLLDDATYLVWQLVLPKGREGSSQTGYNISGSLDVLFSLLSLLSGETECSNDRFQLVTCKTNTRRDIYGGWLAVEVSKKLAAWLENHLEDDLIGFAREAMKRIYFHMAGLNKREQELYRFDFRFQVSQMGRFHMDCPGNACGLDPEWTDYRPNTGYKLIPHNIDAPMQQLTLLGGIAAICDFYWQKQGLA